MNITDQIKPNGICVISLQGDINKESLNDFKEKIEAIVNKTRKKYVINFQSVNIFTSDGASVIVSALKKCKKFQGIIKLSNLSPSIQELFDMTRLNKVFDIYDSEEEALKSMSD